MKLASLAIFAVASILWMSPSQAEDCTEMAAQDMNSEIEAGLLLAETSESLDADGQSKIESLRQEFSKAGDAQTQALESGDDAKLNDVCQTYKDILAQIETLMN